MVVDRWSLRIAAVGRWLVVLLLFGASIGFLLWLAVTASRDYQLFQHGAKVDATVVASAPYDQDPQYLLRFSVDGQQDTQWATGLGRQRVGCTVSILVDRRDHGNLKLTPTAGRLWGVYVLQIVAAAAFGALGTGFLRMDAADFLRCSRARYGYL
jgi:hypothetical protein